MASTSLLSLLRALWRPAFLHCATINPICQAHPQRWTFSHHRPATTVSSTTVPLVYSHVLLRLPDFRCSYRRDRLVCCPHSISRVPGRDLCANVRLLRSLNSEHRLWAISCLVAVSCPRAQDDGHYFHIDSRFVVKAFRSRRRWALTMILDLTPEASILYTSDSLIDVLGYTPEEIAGRSCWEFFPQDELPYARMVHQKRVTMDNAAVLVYCNVKSKSGEYIGCECCFTIVYDVMIVCTSCYRQSGKSNGRYINTVLTGFMLTQVRSCFIRTSCATTLRIFTKRSQIPHAFTSIHQVHAIGKSVRT